jgi:SAM-dependent methyltransferase
MNKKKKVVKINQKIRLDIGCGFNKQLGFTGLDKRKLPGVDIVHDAECFPYPLDDESCDLINMSHVIEHIKPWYQIDIMNECWRLLVMGGVLLISTPYGGSFRYFQDPTHCTPWNEATVMYFASLDQQGRQSLLYQVYKPLPWKIEQLTYSKYGDLNVGYRKIGVVS